MAVTEADDEDTTVLINDSESSTKFHAAIGATTLTKCGIGAADRRVSREHARAERKAQCRECFGDGDATDRNCDALAGKPAHRLRTRARGELDRSRFAPCRWCFPQGVPDDVEAGLTLTGHEIDRWHHPSAADGGDD